VSIKTDLTATNRQIYLTQHSPHYWRVTINHPPLNIFGPKTIPQLNEIITAIETDKELKVVVFDSAIDGFFMTHYDFVAKVEETTSLPPGPTDCSRCPICSCASVAVRLSRSLPFADVRLVSEVSLLWPATCVSPAAKKLSCHTSKWGLE